MESGITPNQLAPKIKLAPIHTSAMASRNDATTVLNTQSSRLAKCPKIPANRWNQPRQSVAHRIEPRGVKKQASGFGEYKWRSHDGNTAGSVKPVGNAARTSTMPSKFDDCEKFNRGNGC